MWILISFSSNETLPGNHSQGVTVPATQSLAFLHYKAKTSNQIKCSCCVSQHASRLTQTLSLKMNGSIWFLKFSESFWDSLLLNLVLHIYTPESHTVCLSLKKTLPPMHLKPPSSCLSREVEKPGGLSPRRCLLLKGCRLCLLPSVLFFQNQQPQLVSLWTQPPTLVVIVLFL